MSTTVDPPGESFDDDDKARAVFGKVVVALPMLLVTLFDIMGGSTEKARAAVENIINKNK
jgi:hypothetical protein